MTEGSPPIEVFCSYAHEDEAWLHKIIHHLRLVERERLLLIWHDRLLKGGMDWAQEIDDRLNHSRLILLLISPDFVASDYCYGIEMRRALERHEANEARVIPILVRPVGNWQIAPFARLQALPPGKFLVEWNEREEDIPLAQIANGIYDTLEDLPMQAVSRPHDNQPVIWNIPYPRNPFFTGREELLSRLHQQFKAGQATALSQSPYTISGLGGIGKTQLALEYAYRHRDDYQYVFWVLADTRNTLNTEYSKIAELLDLPDKNQPEQRSIVEAVKNWLEKNQNWLLILDNADNLELFIDPTNRPKPFSSFLPSVIRGHILLTTRAHALGQLAKRIDIKKLNEEEGCHLLLRRCGVFVERDNLANVAINDWTAAQKIVHELDGLPLALDQAGAYIEETSCGLQNYLEHYHKWRKELFRIRFDMVTDYPESVATTWQLAFDRVKKTNPAAADLLQLCAFLAPDDIPEAIIVEGETELTRLLKKLGHNPLKLDAAIAVLQKYSLISRNPAARTLEVHRLVQAVLRDAMTKKVKRAWAIRTVRAMNRIFPIWKAENWEVSQKLLPHARVCMTLIEDFQIDIIEGAHLLSNAGVYLRNRGEYNEARLYCEKALAISRKVLGDEEITAAFLNNLAGVYWFQGEYEEALAFCQQALAIRKKVLGEEHSDTVSSLANLALLYRDQGQYKQATILDQQALAIRKKVLGEEHFDMAVSLNNLGVLYRLQGKYKEAEDMHKQALAIERQVLGEEHFVVARSLNNLAEVYLGQRRYEIAESVHQQALAIFRKVLPVANPFIAMSLNNRGEVYLAQEKYKEAEDLFWQALTVQRQVLGKQHPDVAKSLYNLAMVYKNQRKYKEALLFFEQALVIRREKLSLGHPDTKKTEKSYKEALQKIKEQK